MSGHHQGGLYEPVLADSEREAVSDLLQYLENVRLSDGLSTEVVTDEFMHLLAE